MADTPVQRFTVGKLKVEVYADRSSLGKAAALAAVEATLASLRDRTETGVVFAAAPSQNEVLQELVARTDMPWSRILGFHLDEYVGIGPDHPPSFRHFLRDHLTRHTQMKEFSEMDASSADPESACLLYAQKLLQAKPGVALLGIGENGHLAFNDPPEANFSDPLDVKVVHLDDTCKQQQVAEGWFKSLDTVPKLAMTLTIPTIMRIPRLIACVPGPRKAEILRRTLEAPVSTACPATILRTHSNATVFLDRDSASLLEGIV